MENLNLNFFVKCCKEKDILNDDKYTTLAKLDTHNEARTYLKNMRKPGSRGSGEAKILYFTVQQPVKSIH